MPVSTFTQPTYGDCEEWRIIPEFPDYEASNIGRVRRAVPCKCVPAGRLMSCYLGVNGYMRVGLTRNGKQEVVPVHRLVLMAFVGPPPSEAHQCAHFDGVRTNNVLSNLRWATPFENERDKDRHGTRPSGDTSFPRLHPERMARGDRNGSRKYPERLVRGDMHPMRIDSSRISGERNGNAKLKSPDIARIKELHLTKGLTQKAVASMFGVSRGLIGHICRGIAWKREGVSQ